LSIRFAVEGEDASADNGRQEVAMKPLPLAAALLAFVWTVSAQPRLPTLAPFAAVRWVGDDAEVSVDGRWYRLLALDGIDAATIVAHCKDRYGNRWQKRFEEDLVQALDGMGHKAGTTVTLKVRDLATGNDTVLEKVPMTEANRRALWEARTRREAKGGRAEPANTEPRRVRRDHATAVRPEFAFLQKRINGDTSASLAPLSRADAEADLDELEWNLDNRYAYAQLRGVDYRAALDAIRAGLGKSIPRGAFAIQIAKLLALFGDGHTHLVDRPMPGGHLPFLVGEAGGRLIAFKPDRSGFVDDAYPELGEIDGVPGAKWLEAALRVGPGGSPQLVRRHAVENLRYFQYLRREFGRPTSDTAKLTLASADGGTRTSDVPVVRDRPTYGTWPRGSHRVLDGGIGYLRIATMSDRAGDVRGIVEAFERFRDAPGLVIDVRGNGGGSRDLLAALFPRFMRPGDPPRVVNVAAVRLGEGERADAPEGYLQDRHLYPFGSRVWSEADRAALRSFASGFKPEWAPPAGQFSDWHYFAIRPATTGAGFFKPTVILMDSGCFSATDIFLGAFKGWRNVTLMGSSSGGGSGRAKRVVLRNSGVAVQLSSMASYQPNGQLYDGRGVAPDVAVEAVATDLIGKTDSVLEAAVKRLAGD